MGCWAIKGSVGWSMGKKGKMVKMGEAWKKVQERGGAEVRMAMQGHASLCCSMRMGSHSILNLRTKRRISWLGNNFIDPLPPFRMYKILVCHSNRIPNSIIHYVFVDLTVCQVFVNITP